MRIVLSGSYNGQDSLGDECLLKAVVERIRHQQPDAEIAVQLHGTGSPFVKDYGQAAGVAVDRGLQSSLWRFAHVLKRLRVPSGIADAWAERGIGAAARLGMFGADAAIGSLQASAAFFVYGGTQFSGQWFRLNAPAYLKSAEIVRAAGGQVFFAPQQYGPLGEAEAATLRLALAGTVTDWRTRNRLDVNLLEAEASSRSKREVYDEVFSAVRLYPSLSPAAPTHILVNLRHSTFDDNGVIEPESFRAFVRLIDGLIERYDLPALFFAVSDASFCDDNAAFAAIRQWTQYPQRISSIGRVRDEYHLFDLANRARLTISMSFHGCLLAGIGGSPFVPVTEGVYYDYKYADFTKYTGGQDVPLISLSACDASADVGRVVTFVEQFDPAAVAHARGVASSLADAFYEEAVGRWPGA